jgi:hypothetical protein
MNFRQVNNQIKSNKGKTTVKKPNPINPDALTTFEIQKFIENSYKYEDRDKNINAYQLDQELSNRYAVIYYNPSNNRAVICHRGTEPSAKDWMNNVQYVMNNYENTERYKIGKQTQDKASIKYGNANLTTIGHSQGSVLSRLSGKDSKQIIQLNPAFLGERQLPNEYVIRSNADPVSALKPVANYFNRILDPKRVKNEAKRNLNILSKSFNLVDEHMYGVLDRVKKTIGTGIKNDELINIKKVNKNSPIWEYSNPKKLRINADKMGYKNDEIYLSDKPDKKYMMFHPETNKKIYWGSMNFQDYLKHNDDKRRDLFLKRNYKWNNFDKYTPAKLSYKSLW